MSTPIFTSKQLESIMDAVSGLYDITRLVDPGECRVLKAEGDIRDWAFQPGPGCDFCYEVWGREERCWDCSSYKAAMSGRIQEKTESIDGDACRIVSVPVMMKDEEGRARSCCLEFIKVLSDESISSEELLPAPSERADERFGYEAQSIENEKAIRILTEAAGHRTDTGVVCFNPKGDCIYSNESAFRLFRIKNDLDEMKSFLDSWIDLNLHEKRGGRWVRQFFNGSEIKSVDVQYFEIKNSDSSPLGSYFSFTDITPLAAGAEVTHFRDIMDNVTGIYNWEGFKEKATEHLARHDSPHLLIRINIKDFKLVNQLFGIDKGNEVLKAVAAMCRELSGNGDVYGRIFNDNFIILTEPEHFDEDRYRKKAMDISDRFGNNLYKLHLQFGMYTMKYRRDDISIMCDRAKMAMKSIKGDRPVSFAEYGNDIILNALYENEIVNSIEEAIRTGQLHIYLQSQNDRFGRPLSAEALARWVHPEQGVIPPEKFIGVLEKANMIHEVDKYIWEQTVKQLRDWTGTKLDKMRLSVNISPRDIANLDIEKEFTDLLTRYGVSPDRLNLEITETAVMADPNAAIELVDRLQKAGFMVEIDDFGSGYSSLNLLKDVHANVLKIDRAFLAKTEQEKRAEVILNHIISMARDLDMGVITEGVETERQLSMLSGLGCRVFQGFYFSKPIPVRDFERKYSA
ncbi:MAG: EAL domain-containing protein [Lachnospiraceae bacterium]|nr:EAL domain-containing protein [Lachnospiraceae bacterium]